MNSLDRLAHSLDVELPEYSVRKADGNDLLQSFNAYGLERTLVLQKGTHVLPLPLTYANLGTSRYTVLRGKGLDTVIKGSIGCTDESLIKSLQTSWTGAPRLILKNLQLEGSGYERFLIDANHMLVSGIGQIGLYGALKSATGTADSGNTTTTVDSERTEVDDYWNGGYIHFTSGANIGLERLISNFDAATDTLTHSAFPNVVGAGDTYFIRLGVGIEQYGDGAPSIPSGFDDLFMFPTSPWLYGINAHMENHSINRVNPCASSGSFRTGVRLTSMNFHIGTIGAFVGGGKSMTHILEADAFGSIGTIYYNNNGVPAVEPYPIKCSYPVKIGNIWTARLPTGTRYTIGADDDTMKTVICDNWLHSAQGASIITKLAPDTTYVLWDAAYDFNIDLSHWKYAKIVVPDGRGTKAGAGKGIGIYNNTDGEMLCDVTFDGIGYGGVPRIGNWVDLVAKGATGTGVKACRIYVKGSEATEDITSVYGILLNLAGWRYA